MPYLAIANTPGYLPDSDDAGEFDTAAEAWQYLRDDLGDDAWEANDPDNDPDGPASLTALAVCLEAEVRASESPGTEGTCITSGHMHTGGLGTVYGPTPGYDGEHDLGKAYNRHARRRRTTRRVSRNAQKCASCRRDGRCLTMAVTLRKESHSVSHTRIR